MNVNRQPEGIPVGGQWATGSKSESEVSLEGAAVSLSQAIADNGGEPIDIHEFEHGDPVFSLVSATADEDNPDQVLISGEVPINFLSGLESAMEDVDEDDRESWLNDREKIINQWMKDRHGVAQVGGTEWDTATGDFETTLPSTAGTDDITGALRDNTKAVDLYNESDPGTFGSPDMWRELGDHLTEYDARADEAARNYLVAAVWSATAEDEDGEVVELDSKYNYTHFSDESAKAAKDQLRDFLFDNREVIAQARETAKARGEEYDDGQIGHDLSLTRNHHGVGFWDRGLGEAGVKLTAAAEALGEAEVEVGDDGRLHV